MNHYLREYILPITMGIVLGAIIGFIIFKAVEKAKGKKILDSTKKEAAAILKEAKLDAESIKKDKMFQAKERFLKLKQEHETKIKERERRMQSSEDRAKAKENKLEHKLSDLNRKEKDIEKILELENNNNIFDKFIYLMFISGRRMAEVKEPKYQVKLNRADKNSVKMNLAKKNKNNQNTLFEIKLTPDTLTGKEFRTELNKMRLITEDISTNDFNRRLNKKINKMFPGKNFHSHTLRGLSAVWNYETNNKKGLSKNGYVMKWLNQDVLDSSLSYQNYKLVEEAEV